MKRLLLTISGVLIFTTTLLAQAKKPTLMVVPSDLYCNEHGYMLTFNNQGKIEKAPDYKKALQTDPELLTAITVIGQMMSDRGFPTKLLEQELKSLESESAEDAMLTSKSGEDVSETPIDILRKKAKSDIIMQVTWMVNRTGPRRSLTFTLQGIDAYTNKQIAACQGTGGSTYSAELPVLIEESVANYLDGFNQQLQNHFDDLFLNGREITLRCKKWNDSEVDFESEFNGKELGEIIEDWISDNTIQGRFNTSDATENMMYFEQVRIPMISEKGRAIDARQWARGLVNHLRRYGVESKLMMKGLGQATIVLGGK
ncbi:MAG: hypothetical protein HUK14_01555 [Muribaculaceae bacterium]|nr:hypothetical protein [Muribaculaceae bacterium]